ncbi:hypothetical protein [Deinococcus aerophilus]|nr:hypothetical protein [Deinococcus aerophilus]
MTQINTMDRPTAKFNPSLFPANRSDFVEPRHHAASVPGLFPLA